MIRPRHAVVSPDVCRRYDQHQRLIARSRRSTSCSSSEASDDDEGKRMSILGSMHCGRKRDDNDKDDSGGGQGGVAGGPGGSGEEGKPYLNCTGSDANGAGDSTRERRSGGATEGCSSTGQQHLCPIPEMTHLDSNRGDCLRHNTAERIARDWASVYTRDYVREISCFGTPPRDVANVSSRENRS
ncbi:hypothetical protein COOONC_14925, partial [Cooperia oncophora]